MLFENNQSDFRDNKQLFFLNAIFKIIEYIMK